MAWAATMAAILTVLWQDMDSRLALALQYSQPLIGEGQGMAERVAYKYLKPKPGSNYRQLFVNGRIRAEILYRETVGTEPLTPQEVAREYGLPVEAVLEAIDYCVHHQDLLDAERGREAARIKAAGRDQWPYAPRDAGPAV
jgi:hypothetical protein